MPRLGGSSFQVCAWLTQLVGEVSFAPGRCQGAGLSWGHRRRFTPSAPPMPLECNEDCTTMCCGPAPIFGVLSVTPAAAATARKPFLLLVGTARAVSTVLLSLLSPTPTPCLQGHLLHVQDLGSGHSSCLQDKQTQHGTQRGACSAHFRFLFCLSCQKPSPWPRPRKPLLHFSSWQPLLVFQDLAHLIPSLGAPCIAIKAG